MRVTPDGMALVAARMGKASAELLVRLTSWEKKAADLATERVVLSMIQAEITCTHPLYRAPLHERLAQTKARIRSLSASLKRRSDNLARLASGQLPLPPAEGQP